MKQKICMKYLLNFSVLNLIWLVNVSDSSDIRLGMFSTFGRIILLPGYHYIVDCCESDDKEESEKNNAAIDNPGYSLIYRV